MRASVRQMPTRCDEAERLDRVGDAEIDDLCQTPLFLHLFFVFCTENEPRGLGVNVLVILKRLEHSRVLRDVGENAKFELRIVGRDQLVAFFGDKRFADPLAELGADRDVLQIWFGRTQAASRGDGLIETAVNASVGGDHFWQSVGVCRPEFVEFAVVDDVLGDLVSLGEFDENVVACRDLSGRGFAAGLDIEFAKYFADLFWRADVKFASGDP